MERHCPRCLLPESEMDTCTNKSFGPQFQCPPPEESDPAKHVHVACGACNKELIIPIVKVMRGSESLKGNCQSDVCQAVVLHEFASTAPVPMTSAPLTPIPPAPTPDATAASTPSTTEPDTGKAPPKAKAPTPRARGGK
jgi:hypothetical protein